MPRINHFSRMQQQSYPALAGNAYVGAWNIQPVSLNHGTVAETIEKIQVDGESKLNAIFISGAFGLVVEVDENSLEETVVDSEMRDRFGVVRSSDPGLFDTPLHEAEKEMANTAVALADRLQYPNLLLIPYSDNLRPTQPKGKKHRLEYRQYMAAFSDEHVDLNQRRLGARNTIELSFNFAGEEKPTIIDGVHFDDQSKIARSKMTADFVAKQSDASLRGRRILLGDLNVIAKHRTAARLISAFGRHLPSEKMQERAERLTNILQSTTPLKRLVEIGMVDAMEGLRTNGLVDTDHAFYDPDRYYVTHWGTYGSGASAHKAIVASFVPGEPDHSLWVQDILDGPNVPKQNWHDMNMGKNSKWTYSEPTESSAS